MINCNLATFVFVCIKIGTHEWVFNRLELLMNTIWSLFLTSIPVARLANILNL